MNNGSSPTNTARLLIAKFPAVVSAKRMIRNLVEKSVKKFRHLTKDVEFAKFKAICEARFCIPCQRHDGSNVPAETPMPSATVDTTSMGQDSLITSVPSVNEDGDGAVVGSSASEPRAGSSSSSGLGLLGFNASATARVISRHDDEYPEETTDLRQLEDWRTGGTLPQNQRTKRVQAQTRE